MEEFEKDCPKRSGVRAHRRVWQMGWGFIRLRSERIDVGSMRISVEIKYAESILFVCGSDWSMGMPSLLEQIALQPMAPWRRDFCVFSGFKF